ncbi:MAG: tetratricopeptide repeat protein [Reichenbachiella sp.]|uniref:tetratricopeptide repeat protein n=1 Tax=Reichenbachiella sp. TaxID=2184521 RepID=UPI00326617B2
MKIIKSSSTFILLFLMILISRGGYTQPTVDLSDRFDYAKTLYDGGVFDGARVAFSQINQEPFRAASVYYMAVSAIKAGHSDGESLMQAFIKKYPYHLYSQEAYLVIAEFYFIKGRYTEALENYNRSVGDLTHQQLFNKGFCEFMSNLNEEALVTFNKLEGTFSTYEYDAAYFQGVIYYKGGAMEDAYAALSTALQSEKYRSPASELYVGALFQGKRYQELIGFVEKELSPTENGLVLNRLADTQFALEKYRSAAISYAELLDNQNGHRTVDNYFRAGFSQLKIENQEKAEAYLKKSAVSDDTVGAYASYYLGIIYENQKNLQFAISSFENTAKSSTGLSEDALYHQSRCLMEVPNYQEAINSLNDYKARFPEGRYEGTVDEMLGTAYANTNNYDQAIAYIERLERLSPQLKRTYQRVSFLKGVTLFNDKKFEEAKEVFQGALLHDENNAITQQSYFWMGETLSLLNELDDAIFYYRSVQHAPDQLVYLKAQYSKAYVYFNEKDYASAFDTFSKFISEENKALDQRYRTDALLRMGDCQYAMKGYTRAIDFYKKAQQTGNKNLDHIYFQIGLLNRYLENHRAAKQYFSLLIKELPNSPKVDHAYFQIAQIEFEKGSQKEAIRGFDTFLARHPSSEFVPFALLNQAVAYDNEAQYDRSISNYKEILDRFPKHKTANSALLGLQSHNAASRFDEFDTYLKLFKEANPTSGALENVEFESSRANYYNQQYAAAIKGLRSFVSAYPNSSFVLEAKYLIGDAYYRSEQLNEALVSFKQLENTHDYAKYSKVLNRIATIYKNTGEAKTSNEYYYKMGSLSLSAKDVIHVNNGLMENYFALGIYDSAKYYGNQLLVNPRVSAMDGAQAGLIIGKSEYFSGNLELALQSFLPLVANAPDERGAEAYYYISKIYFDQAKYDLALESLFILTNNFQAYERWLGEAYLLMATIYIETNELFQAKATLNSLITHVALKDIKLRAQEKLEDIEDSIDSNEE